MVLAVVVHCISLVLRVGAILALLVARVRLLALLPLRTDKAVEGIVLPIRDHAFVFIQAVRTLLIWAVVAPNFGRHDRSSFADAVWAL